jgi:ligand-binding sensor domain-containing protein
MGQRRKLPVRTILGGGAAVLVAAVAFVGWRVAHALRASREEVRSERTLSFVSRPYVAPASPLFESVSAPVVFQRAAQFQNHLFLAGPAGLQEYDGNGALLRSFSPGRELPSSALVALATGVLADSRGVELLIATSEDGLLAFNGASFRQILPGDPEARAITTILPGSAGHLLIGTKNRGVLVFDGRQIASLHSTLATLYVTSLAGDEADLWVGTLNRGVFHWHSGTTEAFGEEQGLPDRQVQSLAISGETAFVGTAAGVAEFDRGRFSHVLAPGVFATALLATPSGLLVGTEDQGVRTISLAGRGIAPRSGVSPELAEVRQILQSGDAVYVLTRNGLYRMNGRGFALQQVFNPGAATLSDRNVSALAADSSGRIWVGYFDRGLDILQSDSGKTRHVENDHVFCVNRILPEAKTGTVVVATANGLVRFSASGSEQQVLTRADGLIADHVTDVAPYRNGLAIATPAGLTFLDAGGARSLYAFHGLVNNHVYALGVSGDELVAGTLGGLSMIGKDEVRMSYTASNSALKHNWITAVVAIGDEWMVGTYGGGIMRLDRAGRFHGFDEATGPFEVNPNGMLVTARYVFAGTLGRGLYVYERETAHWKILIEGLPSANVTALAEANGYLYVGTDNGLVRVEERKLQP